MKEEKTTSQRHEKKKARNSRAQEIQWKRHETIGSPDTSMH